MGGGTEASWRCRKMRVITDSWVMTAMIRSVPCWQNGQVRISSPKTRPSSRAHGQYGVSVVESPPPPGEGLAPGQPLQLCDAAQEPAARSHPAYPSDGDRSDRPCLELSGV